MRSIWRTLTSRLESGLLRDIALVCAADGLVGASFGAIAVGSGFPLWLPMLMSLVVFAGAAQFMFVGLIAAGGNPIAAVLAGLLVNARHLPFGFAVGDVFGRGLVRRAAGAHLMIDETVAFALAQRDADRRRAAFWACGIALFVCWNVGVVAGAFGGTVISDTDAFGLDAAFPAVLLALVLPSLKDRSTRLAAAVGVVVALVTSPWLPAGVPVLLALAGVLVALGAAPDGPRDPASTSRSRSEEAT
ncbi:AzlC family ABC transporter permease [Prauserella halophila]|uniref:AzlC family ABC transporter permease n=1 Tax=Prauserella halophila TaxID=185641 RepID=A0ABP4GPE9_9PSEU|nr:AzlC family ABC transporter permease [Prauserella halophila]MCP2238706.1 4-azaleucine resistance probable transporter AzlC [Prauserella halophila]